MLVVNSASTIAKYNSLVAKNKPILVLFHAEWCGHCKELEPEWKQFVKSVRESMPIASVESSFMGEVQGYKEIDGFPTLMIIRGNNVIQKFNGQRTASAIKQFYMKYSKRGGSKKRRSTKKRRQTRRMRGGGCGCNQFK
jgi:thioredoxin-like negative regulator of GroEL